MKSTAENLLLWEQRIKERAQSGLTVGEWCTRNGVSKHQYNYWNMQVRKNRKKDEELTFAEISSVLSNTGAIRQNSVSASDFQVFFKNIRITVPCDFNPVALTGLMKVLQEL